VHGLKNVLKNIGASALGNCSAQLEKAALNNDQLYCDEQYQPFRAALLELADRLNNALQENAEAVKETANKSLLMQAVTEAKAAAENFDRDRALEIISPHTGFTYDEQTDKLVNEIVTALEAFDCERALEFLLLL